MTRLSIRAVSLALTLLAAATAARAAVDQFGVAQLYPNAADGMQWFSRWNNGVSRTFTGVDPYDAWFDADHGDAKYYVDGRGLFKITGSTPRMYIHDPAKARQWRNVEMTVYAMRVADDGTPYAGIVGVSRSNHGTTGSETANLCDTRGYGARVRYDGAVDFEKETRHPTAVPIMTKRLYSGAMPKNVWIGYKHVTYDLPNGNVVNELWIDQTDGSNGGSWVKVLAHEDNGANFGVGAPACRSGVNPALRLTNGARAGSESGKPNVTVYWRSTNVGANGLVYKKMSVREIAAGGTTGGTTTTAMAPRVTSVASTNITQSSAFITWNTDKVSHSQVEYGLTAAYGQQTYMSNAEGLAHSMPLSGLQAGKTYHYRVKSFDDATRLTGVSGDLTFTTKPSLAAPVISAVMSSNLTQTSAFITWNTDKISHSQVEYGLTTAYGKQSYLSTATGLAHSMPLSGLEPGKTYHYRVKSLDDATKLTGVSGDFTFTTPGAATAGGTTNVISGVQALNVTSSGALLSWKTTVISHSQADYGPTSAYGSQTPMSTATGLWHSMPLSGLRPGTVYHYRVKSRDAAGKTAVSTDFTFRTAG